MSDNKGSGLIVVVVVLAAIGLVLVVGCGGCTVGMLFVPALMVGAIVDDAPLPVSSPTPDPVATEAARLRICDALALGEPAVITGEELGRFVQGAGMAEVPVFNVGFSGDRGVLDVSVRPDPAEPTYFNLHLAGTFVMERGWVTVATVDELEASGWNLGSYLAGEDLVSNFNQSLANERAESPDMAALLDSFATIAIRDGGLSLVPVAPGVTLPFCDPPTVPLEPVAPETPAAPEP